MISKIYPTEIVHFTHFHTSPKIPKNSLERVKSSNLGTNSLKVRALCRTQATSHNSHGVVDGGVNEAGVSTVALDRSAAAYSAVECTRVKVTIFAILLLQHPSQSQQAASRTRCRARCRVANLSSSKKDRPSPKKAR